jgi:hypothetical protein
MEKVVFHGRVLPPHIQITANSPKINWRVEEFDITITCSVLIDKSVATVILELQEWRLEYLSDFHKRATDLARATVNMLAFSTGHGLFVMIDSITYPHGVLGTLHRQELGVERLVTSFSLDPSRLQELNDSFLTILFDHNIFIALDDITSAVINGHMAQANCGRAIEMIRNIISPKKISNAAWKEMQEALNVSREYQESISKDLTANRHGASAAVPGPIVSKTIERTWSIMNRLIEYKKRGSVPLKPSEFPLLVL